MENTRRTCRGRRKRRVRRYALRRHGLPRRHAETAARDLPARRPLALPAVHGQRSPHCRVRPCRLRSETYARRLREHGEHPAGWSGQLGIRTHGRTSWRAREKRNRARRDNLQDAALGDGRTVRRERSLESACGAASGRRNFRRVLRTARRAVRRAHRLLRNRQRMGPPLCRHLRRGRCRAARGVHRLEKRLSRRVRDTERLGRSGGCSPHGRKGTHENTRILPEKRQGLLRCRYDPLPRSVSEVRKLDIEKTLPSPRTDGGVRKALVLERIFAFKRVGRTRRCRRRVEEDTLGLGARKRRLHLVQPALDRPGSEESGALLRTCHRRFLPARFLRRLRRAGFDFRRRRIPPRRPRHRHPLRFRIPERRQPRSCGMGRIGARPRSHPG